MSLVPLWNVPKFTSCLLADFDTPFSCHGEAGGIILLAFFQIIMAFNFVYFLMILHGCCHCHG